VEESRRAMWCLGECKYALVLNIPLRFSQLFFNRGASACSPPSTIFPIGQWGHPTRQFCGHVERGHPIDQLSQSCIAVHQLPRSPIAPFTNCPVHQLPRSPIAPFTNTSQALRCNNKYVKVTKIQKTLRTT
jgi:hypothetical protein